jgi:hypothetical protein
MPHRIPTQTSAANLIETIVDDFRPAQWLVDECQQLVAQDENYFPCVALGLIGRLAIGTMPTKEKKSILRKFPAKEYPARRVTAWWKNRREIIWPELESLVMKKAVGLTGTIFDMREMDFESIAETATLWLRKRDNLESIVFLVGKDADWYVKPKLAEVDRLAKLYRRHYTRIFSDQRLNSVAECQLNAWWSTVATQHLDRPTNGA